MLRNKSDQRSFYKAMPIPPSKNTTSLFKRSVVILWDKPPPVGYVSLAQLTLCLRSMIGLEGWRFMRCRWFPCQRDCTNWSLKQSCLQRVNGNDDRECCASPRSVSKRRCSQVDLRHSLSGYKRCRKTYTHQGLLFNFPPIQPEPLFLSLLMFHFVSPRSHKRV